MATGEKTAKVKPLGKRTPWVWAVESVEGCNLSCWHCPARLIKETERQFMSRETWTEMCRVIHVATPRTRLELAQSGEPTLHPHLLELLATARSLTPTTQLQVTTNGLKLMSGEVTYQELFGAGAHTVYVDMYHPVEDHIELARASGVEWYTYDRKMASSPNHRVANTYYNDSDLKLIILQDNPKKRHEWRKAGRLSTFLNHIDWRASMPYGLVPVREPYARKCNLPQRYATINWRGEYTFCCTDFLGEACGLMGGVYDGPEGFRRYWFSRLMQSIRRRLADKDRAGVPYCSRCNCAFSKCDWTGIWPDGSFDWWLNGDEWDQLPDRDLDHEVFADGWEKTRAANEALPSAEDEQECIDRLRKGEFILSTKDQAGGDDKEA